MTGHGLGAALMDWAIAEARAWRADALQLSVFSENFGAQRFYQRYGFDHVADIDFWVGNHRDDEFLYELRSSRASCRRVARLRLGEHHFARRADVAGSDLPRQPLPVGRAVERLGALDRLLAEAHLVERQPRHLSADSSTSRTTYSAGASLSFITLRRSKPRT
jgi:hypothetical protein